jgi:NifU-like protein involved in Fe-S cluster formation
MNIRYSVQVNELFEDSSHVLRVSDASAGAVAGVAGSYESGALVGFMLRVDGARIAFLRFQAFGCPDLIAACAYVAASFEGQDLSVVDTLNTADLMRSLQIPTEKAGKILVLQDALQNCREQLLSVS